MTEIRTIKHVKKVSHAMKLRFYGKSNRRTNYHEFKKTSFDRKLISARCHKRFSSDIVADRLVQCFNFVISNHNQ